MRKIFIFVFTFLVFFKVFAQNECECTQLDSTVESSMCFESIGLDELKLKNYGAAYSPFLRGIEIVGSNYNENLNAIDDTSQNLTFAKTEKDKGNISVASHLVKGVLRSRISMISSGK